VEVNLEAFVFLEDEVVNSVTGSCPRMENILLDHARWHLQYADFKEAQKDII
jgi:hypothetical protein